MKKFALPVLYVLSIVVAVGIGMAQVGKDGSGKGSIDCPTVKYVPCSNSGPCTLNYQVEDSKGDKMVWARTAIRCNEPKYPGCILPEGPQYTTYSECD